MSLIQFGAAIVVEVLEYKELTKKSYSFIIKIPARWVALLSVVVMYTATVIWSRCGVA